MVSWFAIPDLADSCVRIISVN